MSHEIQRLQQLAGLLTESDWESKHWTAKENRGMAEGPLRDLQDYAAGGPVLDGDFWCWGIDAEREIFVVNDVSNQNDFEQKIIAMIGENAWSAVADEGAFTEVSEEEASDPENGDVFVVTMPLRLVAREINKWLIKTGAQHLIKPIARRR